MMAKCSSRFVSAAASGNLSGVIGTAYTMSSKPPSHGPQSHSDATY
jgi:hypothetical protein